MRTSKHPLLLSLALLTILTLTCTGCSSLFRHHLKEPVVTVASLEWGHVHSFRSSSLPLILTVRVMNPNSFAIKARSLTYAVRTRDDVIIKGSMATLPEFPSDEETLVHIPLSVSPLPLINSLQKSLGRLSVAFTVYGSITLESFAGDIQIPFRKEIKKNLKKILTPGRKRSHH